MILVVDASVAVKWFVAENLHDEAHEVLDHGDALRAPDFIATEIANIVWKKSIRKEISREQAQRIVKEFTEIPDYIPAFHPLADLVERALDLALILAHPVYGCLYIACAEAAGGVLVTADEGLCNAVQDTRYARLVRRLGEPGFLKEDTP